MGPLQIIGGILLIISAILIIGLVIMQESKQSGLSAMTGGSDSYLSKNKGKTLDSKLAFLTKVFAIAFFIITLAVNLVIKYIK